MDKIKKLRRMKQDEDVYEPVDPADYSYFEINDLLDEGNPWRPRTSKVWKGPSRGRSGRYVTNTVWLSNNRLKGLSGLKTFLEIRLEDLKNVTCLDLCANMIAQLDQDLLSVSSVEVLYLHCNCIDNFEEVGKLRGLKWLKILTLYGNPVEPQPDYRLKVLSYLPKLRRLDFSTVTGKERLLSKLYESKKKKEEKDVSEKKEEKSAQSAEGIIATAASSENDLLEIEMSEEEEDAEVSSESESFTEVKEVTAAKEEREEKMPEQINWWTKDEKQLTEAIYRRLKDLEKGWVFNYFE